MSTPPAPYVPSSGAVLAAAAICRICAVPGYNRQHPGAHMEEIMRAIDAQFPSNPAHEHAMASCHALIKDGDTQAAIDHARRALGLPVS